MKKLQKTLPEKSKVITETGTGSFTFKNVFAYAWIVEGMSPMDSSRYATLICCDWPERYKQAVRRLMDNKPISQMMFDGVTVESVKNIFHLKSDLKTLEMLLILEKNPEAWQAITSCETL